MRLYVGNISYSTGEGELRALFESYGPVSEVKIITDRDSGRSRGYAFISMGSPQAGQEAIAGLHQTNFGGRAIVVSTAKERGASSPRQNYGW